MDTFTLISVIIGMLVGLAATTWMLGLPTEWKQNAEDKLAEKEAESETASIVKDQLNKIPEADHDQLNKVLEADHEHLNKVPEANHDKVQAMETAARAVTADVTGGDFRTH